MATPTPPQLSPEPTLGERFGLNLWRSRRQVDLSQEALANLVGLSRPHISVLERGLELPRLDTILKLAAAMNVSVCVLLAGMKWRPGSHVDGDLHVEHPAAGLRRSVRH
ncbi:MAG TPA: helix-turn-helix transcriptional regulator [Solirubrobacterales bacterium]|nr:helix-turn-helix transcriptional regulator [Solirubrobacterales bacterium]